MPRSIVRFCLMICLALLTGILPAAASPTVLPIRLDYPLIRSFFVQQAFTDPEEAAVVIDENDGCQFLKLQHPDIFAENGDLRLKAHVTLKTGLPLLGSCRMPFELEGVMDVRLHVQLDVSGWTLRFQAEDLRFTTLDGKSGAISANVMELFRQRLFGHLDQVTVNLSTPVEELRSMLPLFFHAEAQPRISKWLQSIRPGRIEARPEFYSLELAMDIEDEPAGEAPGVVVEKQLSSEEVDRFLRSWEAWDAFLVYQIGRLGEFGLDDQERSDILQTLLETRYQLTAALAAEQQDPATDLVRRQFLTVWERFAPLFRKYLARDPSVAPLSFLVYLSAGDALAALDKLGPTLGLDISRDGLLRLARLMNESGPAVNLDYSFTVDPALRKTLGFGPPLQVPDQIFPVEDVDIENFSGDGAAGEKIMFFRPSTWLDLSPRAAYAADLPSPDLQALKTWLVDMAHFDAYQQRVRSLLQEASARIVDADKLPAERRDLFEKIMQATAWQESCFRQFTVKKGRMTYLRSWNNSSVGLMQINERVWRGLYRVDALRWDPRYNIQAGSEILCMYLSDYVLKKAAASSLNEEGQVRATYALYNGGPQNFKNFLARHAKGDYYKSDALFWEKYGWARAGEFDKLKACLNGE